MKRTAFIGLALFCAIHVVLAQLPENLNRQVFAKIGANEVIEFGEFQVELSKASGYSANSVDNWMSYSYVTKNRYSGKGNVITNGSSLNPNHNMQVRTYRIGPSSAKSIYVMKNKEPDKDYMGYDMEMVRAYGLSYPACDSVVLLSDDGYVYFYKGAYYYRNYSNTYDNKSEISKITWLERKVYEGEDKLSIAANAKEISRLSFGDVYYESAEGHYYYLYRDQYMPNSVLVVDGNYVELFGQYSDNDFKLKFSYDGKHWMAIGHECFWIDGKLKSVEGYSITDFVITNGGHYGYKAKRNGVENEGETVVVDGQLIRRNARVTYFALDAKGNLKFRFVSGGRILQYENENLVDVTKQLESVYYPECEKNNDLITILSNDGMHKLTYQKDKQGVEIDGVRLTESVPCYAIMDEQNKCFVWNAIEVVGEETELVIYRYNIVNNFFKNIFR